MISPAVLLAALVLQHPVRDSSAAAARAAREAAFDTSKAILSHIARPVGEVKSALDVYRRAVFNGTDEDVLHNADYLRASCAAVDSTAKVMAPRICLHCAARDVQAAFDGYRRMLPSLRRGMAQCTAHLWTLERASDAAKRLRHDVRVVGNPVVMTLRDYEAHLAVLLKALNITATTQPPPVHPHRPAPARP